MQAAEETMKILNPDQIYISKDFNPRRLLDKTEMKNLTESIKHNGVLQSIIVRYREDGPGYSVIAGHRRLIAAKNIGLKGIPAIVKNITDTEAQALSLIENNPSFRINISPIEEAIAGRKIFDQCNGDLDDCLKHLGWNRRKFDSRQLLLHASSAVQEALISRSIKIGHAELLCQLPRSTQEGTVAQIIDKNISVSELREKINGYALSLDNAIFPTDACLQCNHNSSRSQPLFKNVIDKTRCLDLECFNNKTREALERKKVALQSEFNAVYLDTEFPDPSSYEILYATNENGVGEQQFQTCRACANLGTIISTRVGEVGTIVEDICFDTACREKHIKTYQKSLQSHEHVQTRSDTEDAQEGKKGNPPTGTANKKPASTQPPALPSAVVEKVDTFFRNLAAKTLETDRKALLATLMFAALQDAGFPSYILENGESIQSYRQEALVKLYSLDTEATNKLILKACKHIYASKNKDCQSGTITRTAEAVVRISSTSLERHFVLGEDFLKVFTKSGISSLLSESGFDIWFQNKHGEKAYKKLLAGKKDELIKQVLTKSGFDFTGFVPGIVSKRIAARQTT